jgi:hypothetical protein
MSPHSFDDQPAEQPAHPLPSLEGRANRKREPFADRRFWIGLLVGAGLMFSVLSVLDARSAWFRFMKAASDIMNADVISKEEAGYQGFRSVAPSTPVSRKWSGQGAKTAETFTIASREWKICWATKVNPQLGIGIFQLYLYDGSGELVSVPANVIGTDSDCSVMHQRGSFYIQVNAIQPWELSVTAE